MADTDIDIRLQESEILLDSIYDGIWVIDADGVTLRINKATERITGLHASDVVGKHVTEPMKMGLMKHCITLQAMEQRRSVTMFDEYANGKRCLNTSTPIFDKKGNIWRVIAIIRDMTFLEMLQRRLFKLEIEAQTYRTRLHNLELGGSGTFIGNSVTNIKLHHELAKAARSEAITLIQGDTGTGKSMAARAIHDQSDRVGKPFLVVNCGAIPENLMESELFGYEKGAFTGASPKGKPGMFELAADGTLFLDEIGELPLQLQAKLLQVLDGQPFMHIGGTKPIYSKARIIAATNRDLNVMVKDGTFRSDLYYRLRIISIRLPALREHVNDIPVLAMHFLKETCDKENIRKNFNPTVLNCFMTYDWPGNVRELKSLVQSLCLMSEGPVITIDDLPEYLRPADGMSTQSVPQVSLEGAVRDLEKRMIVVALLEMGSTYGAAKKLGTSQTTVMRKVRQYGIDLVHFHKGRKGGQKTPRD